MPKNGLKMDRKYIEIIQKLVRNQIETNWKLDNGKKMDR